MRRYAMRWSPARGCLGIGVFGRRLGGADSDPSEGLERGQYGRGGRGPVNDETCISFINS
ncbi:hypothetical protein BD626DRAFT_521845 [Schizophyllum amplum]|uniref:Uncharacterized protein n=1 Tax=Schizophyllum amplum TaxID=97359 RepID=A0A550BTK8_9AGAR|nr:hypothetical protein BD626DRAFT_521845 [Auriculariopsis ampla]